MTDVIENVQTADAVVSQEKPQVEPTAPERKPDLEAPVTVSGLGSETVEPTPQAGLGVDALPPRNEPLVMCNVPRGVTLTDYATAIGTGMVSGTAAYYATRVLEDQHPVVRIAGGVLAGTTAAFAARWTGGVLSGMFSDKKKK